MQIPFHTEKKTTLETSINLKQYTKRATWKKDTEIATSDELNFYIQILCEINPVLWNE